MSRSAGRVVLVTGVSMDLGQRLARRLTADPRFDRVIGVDVLPPRGDIGEVSFVRADIRNPVIAKVIARETVDTVVHMSVIASPGNAGGRTSMKELNVIGTMQLLAACQQAPSLQQLVVKSSTSYYGASAKDPAMFTEDMGPRRQATGYGKDVFEVESYVRGFARRRPDVTVTMLRAANVVGSGLHSPMIDYFKLPVIPTALGFDARLQFLHEHDLLGAVQHAAGERIGGTYNLAGDGILMLSQAIRRLGRPAVKLPGPGLGQVGGWLRQARIADFTADQVSYLRYGRGVDTTRMRSALGYEPAYDTEQAFADLASTLRAGVLSPLARREAAPAALAAGASQHPLDLGREVTSRG